MPRTSSAQLAPTPAPVLDASHLSAPIDLTSTWLVHPGDDPAFSEPSFDDSGWTPFDPRTDVKLLLSGARPEIIWYRLRVKVNPTQSHLALKEESLSRAFEVYLNGERLIAAGQVAPFRASTMRASVMRPIPDSMLSSGLLVIALRVHISKNEWSSTNPGFFASNLTLGQEEALYQRDWLAVIGENLLNLLDVFLLVSVGIVALVLFAVQRHQSEYLWICVLGLLRLAELPYQMISLFHNIPVGWDMLTKCVNVVSPIAWVSMYFAFVQQRFGWRMRTYLIVAGLLNAYSSMGNLVPGLPGSWALLENMPFVTLLAVFIPIVLIIHLRRGNREAGILLIPVVLLSLYIYAKFTMVLLFQLHLFRNADLKGLDYIDNFHAGPFVLGLNPLSGILSSISLAIIMLLRATSTSRRQALIEGELAAAQQVQHILVPEHTEPVPGFVVESAYQPAQQVGGDFFQILPTDQNGLLLVVGDVAGKGLPAAMMVALLVGAIRTAAEETVSPDILLQRLNERLVGRSGGGFSTALAAHIAADGTVIIGNAGHLPPYLDGEEIDLPGALPLGILSGTQYETTRFHLPHGSRLTFYSDGVIEAQNQKMELFGFDRGRQISTLSANAIVEAAKAFGQADDITVVAIARNQ